MQVAIGIEPAAPKGCDTAHQALAGNRKRLKKMPDGFGILEARSWQGRAVEAPVSW